MAEAVGVPSILVANGVGGSSRLEGLGELGRGQYEWSECRHAERSRSNRQPGKRELDEEAGQGVRRGLC